MNEKINLNLIIILFLVSVILGGATGWGLRSVFNPADKPDNRGIESYRPRERELLERIAGYERREQERNARENKRIEREGARIEQTEKRLGAIREFNRRSGDLLESLAMEVGVLQDIYFSLKREYFNAVNSDDSEKIND